MRLKKEILFFLLMGVVFACGGETEEIIEPEPPEPMTALEYGTVSGMVTDANTGNAVPGTIVMVLGESYKTGVDGSFTFQGVVYAEEHTLLVTDPDYADQSRTFALMADRVTVDVALVPLKDHLVEMEDFFEHFADLLKSVDVENIGAIQELFSETYVAADDPATIFGVASGIIPENYVDVVPAITQLFEEYVSLQFLFRDIGLEVTHARKAAVTLQLDLNARLAGAAELDELKASCKFEFRREGMDWKITHWQLFALDVRL